MIRDINLLANGVTGDFLIGALAEFENAKTKYSTLKAAYESKPPITDRLTPEGMPNNRLVHNYGRYIVAVASGYLVGSPVSYQGDNLDDITAAYTAARVDSIDAELAKDASLYGRGVELCYSDEDAKPRTASIDPAQAFVVYADDVAGKAILGVRYIAKTNAKGEINGYVLTVYTDAEELTYTGKTLEDAAKSLPDVKPHFFGAVPMVEYWNNDDATGDFEHVLSLINAYDILQSDRVNDKEQLVQAILVMTGARMEAEPDTYENGIITQKGRTAAQQIRQDKMIFLPDKDATAEYLTKQLSEADVEVLKDSINSDIHKFAMVPDLTDKEFAANASGVAMRYKLFGLEQLTKVKERWFREALRERLKLFSHFLSVKGAANIDYDKINIMFKRSLPVNEKEIAEMVNILNGIVPRASLLSQVPFIDDVDKAVEELKAEKAEGLAAQQAAFGMPLAQEEEM